MYRAGLSEYQIAVAFYGRLIALLVGSKMLYLFEAWPDWATDGGSLVAALFSEQLRLPGGLLLMVATAPFLARATGVRHLALADAIAPAGGLLILGIRVGCFLQGCCHGTPSELPWAVRFPPTSDAYVWQLQENLISVGAPLGAAVHPLQLYFAAVGVLLFIGLTVYQHRKRYEGEILLWFGLCYFWSSWMLEFFRARPHAATQEITLLAAVAASAAAGAIEWRIRRTRVATAVARS
jgi:phosphatidylglycerol:prolipoprotein diacylglycerol transferase